MAQDEVVRSRTGAPGRWLADESARGRGLARAADAAAVVVLAVVIAVSARWTLDVEFLDTPVTGQLFGVLLAGAVLGGVRGGLAALLYLAAGLLGAPVFEGGTSGLEHLDAPGAGYLLAFPVAALVVGLIAHRHAALRTSVSTSWIALGCLTGLAVTYAVGIPVLVAREGLEGAEILFATATFLPFDVAKVALATGVAALVHRVFPGLLRT